MSATSQELIRALGWDERRGVQAMLWFILTEAMLFVSLFFSYFFLASRASKWPMDPPPKVGMALVMMLVLFASGAVVEFAAHCTKRGQQGTARALVLLTAAIGALFLFLQSLEYRERLLIVTPSTDAYGAIFYTITSTHAAHVLLGMFMLAYVAILPRLEPGLDRPPHRPLQAVAWYWHFTGATWAVIVGLLYVLPNL